MKRNPNFKYESDITKTNTKYGANDIFEIYLSHQDKIQYIISPNIEHKLDIFRLIDNKKLLSLNGHKNDIMTIRYFINNKDFREYLISGDDDKIVIIWDITNNYQIKYKIETKYGKENYIFSCLLIFPHNDNNNYIITSSANESYEMENSVTKIYSLNTGEYIRYISNTNININYLLSWHNKKNGKYYIIQFAFYELIMINNLVENELYAKLESKSFNNTFGYIYSKDNKEYLCSSSDEGTINIWDLYNKTIFEIIRIKIKDINIHNFIYWNDKYIIVPDYINKLILIIDLTQKKVISKIKGENVGKIKGLKKLYHPKYGESLLTAGEEGIIKLWIIKNNLNINLNDLYH